MLARCICVISYLVAVNKKSICIWVIQYAFHTSTNIMYTNQNSHLSKWHALFPQLQYAHIYTVSPTFRMQVCAHTHTKYELPPQTNTYSTTRALGSTSNVIRAASNRPSASGSKLVIYWIHNKNEGVCVVVHVCSFTTATTLPRGTYKTLH